MIDALVVGGGPVGGQTARLLAERGFRVELVEEHSEVGQPVQCAGLFTPRVFDHVPFSMDEVWLNDIRGAHVRSPGGRIVTLDGGKAMAVATDRAKFDRLCVEAAERSGARIRLRTKCLSAKRVDANHGSAGRHEGQSAHARPGSPAKIVATLSTPEGVEEVETQILIGADGVQSAVAKWFGLPRAKEILPCYGAQVEGTRLDPAFVEMFLGAALAPGFFSWMIPTDPRGSTGKVEVGTGFNAPRPAKHYYDLMWTDPSSAKFLASDARSCFDICGCIPLGPLPATSADSVMLVGDAAAQTKPTSGGGVYTGLRCAEHLATAAAKALASGDVGAKALAEYDRLWRDDLGYELTIGWRLRKAFCRLRDEQVDRLFEILDDKEVLATVNLLGDIDYPSRLARGLLRKAPSLFQFSGPLLRSLAD
ncbi:MAG: geranylgeranyl reductase family protein [Thermoplasmatota archaeon]